MCDWTDPTNPPKFLSSLQSPGVDVDSQTQGLIKREICSWDRLFSFFFGAVYLSWPGRYLGPAGHLRTSGHLELLKIRPDPDSNGLHTGNNRWPPVPVIICWHVNLRYTKSFADRYDPWERMWALDTIRWQVPWCMAFCPASLPDPWNAIACWTLFQYRSYIIVL